jgi:thioredoxin reductase (NADPH)
MSITASPQGAADPFRAATCPGLTFPRAVPISAMSYRASESGLSGKHPAVSMHSKVVILGSGPAGCTAAIYAARAMLNPVVIAGLQPGGQLTITTEIENFPGFADPIQGPWLVQQMEEQAKKLGTTFVNDVIAAVDLKTRPFVLTGDSGEIYTADTLIIATGAQANWLGLPSESKFQGFGVSACATCDGFFYRGKNVAVVGGGNTAAEEALYLTNFADHVTLIHRRAELRCDKTNQARLEANPKIAIAYERGVVEVTGSEEPKSVTGVVLRNTRTGATETLAVDGLFVAIGHAPATALFKGQVKMDESGYIKTAPDSTATGVAGVFAAGDVKDHTFRQAVTAAGMGCMAALEAERFLSGAAAPQPVKTKPAKSKAKAAKAKAKATKPKAKAAKAKKKTAKAKTAKAKKPAKRSKSKR